MSICKQISLTAKSDSIEILKSLLTEIVEPSRQEQGCLRYELFQIESEPAQFFIIEEWQSSQDLERHKETEHFLRFKSLAPSLVADKASIAVIPLA